MPRPGPVELPSTCAEPPGFLSGGKATNSFAITAVAISVSFQTATAGSLLLAQTLGNSALTDCDWRRKKATECATDADTIRSCSEVFGEVSVLENPKPI